jgi:hypothetical protein
MVLVNHKHDCQYLISGRRFHQVRSIEFSAEHPHTVPPRWNTLRLIPIAVRPDTTHGLLERYSLILIDFDDASIPSIQQPSLDVIGS